MQKTKAWWLKEFCGKWKEPETKANSICSFDLFFLTRFAEYVSYGDEPIKVTEFGCGATTIELCRLGVEVECFSVGVSNPAKEVGFNPIYSRCNVMDPEWLDKIIESIKTSHLLVIDALHTEEFAEYYVKNIFPYVRCPIWIHDYWNTNRGSIPCGEQRYLDREVIGATHEIWTMTDLPLEELREVSKEIGFDLTIQRHNKWPQNIGPRMCSMVLIQKEEYMEKHKDKQQ